MTTEIKYLVIDIISPDEPQCCETLPQAILKAAQHDGFGACFARMDENENISKENPMRFFSNIMHIGNNPYTPRFQDSEWECISDNPDDKKAIEEVSNQLFAKAKRGLINFHPRYDMEIYKVELCDGKIKTIDGKSIEKIAEEADDDVQQVHDYYLSLIN